MDIISLGKTVKNTKNLASNKIVCMGDSITYSSAYSTPYPTHLSWAHGYEFINKGVSGNTVGQVLARLQADCIDYSPSHCILLVGTNDITAGTAISTVMPTMHNLCERLRQNGIKPIICSLTPRTGTADILQAVLTYNRSYRRYCFDYGIQFIDLYTMFVDSTGAQLTTYFPDGLHPDYRAKKMIADTIITKTNFPVYLDTCYPNETQAIVNNFFLTDSDSDGRADNWSPATGGGASLHSLAITAHPTYGNWQEFGISGGSNVDSFVNLFQVVDDPAYVTVGNILDFSADFLTDALTDCYWALRLQGFTSATVSVSDAYADLQTRTRVSYSSSLVRVFGSYTVPPTVTKVSFRPYLYGTGTSVLKVGNVSLRKRDIW
jgi:lysophospholipase L1-like esterase